MKMFFAKSACDDDDGIASRYFCGSEDLIENMGPDPRQLRVFEIDTCLETLLCSISTKVENSIKLRSKWEKEVEFNSIEFQFFVGPNAFCGIQGGDGEFWNNNKNNKAIGQHVECRFLEGGGQASTDSADGNHPIAIATIGETLKLNFFTQKQIDGTWQEACEEDRVTCFDLTHNSLFVAMPWEDEMPKQCERGHWTRKAHSVEFDGDDLAVAMVFRKVTNMSVDLFEKDSGAWVFDESGPAQRFLDKHQEELDRFRATSRLPKHKAAMQEIATRLKSFLETKVPDIKSGRDHNPMELDPSDDEDEIIII